MEKKIIEGEFAPNKISIGIGIVGVALFMLLCFFLLFIIGPISIICIGPFIAGYAFIIYLNCTAKHQKLIVTNTRVYGIFRKKEINLPLDKIAAVDIRKRNLTFSTGSGIIRCAGCTNARAVYDVILNLLNERASGTASVPEELMEYKKLLDNGVITQEEFEAKKKKLLGL